MPGEADPLDEDELEDVAEALDALSNPRRLRILQLLTRPRYRKEVGSELDLSRQAASRHIDKLLDRGFIREMEGWRESGPVKEYHVVPERLFALGMSVAELGKLQPEGGPAVEADRTTELQEDGEEPADEGSPGEARLLVANGPKPGTTLTLEGSEGRWTLGREEDRDLVIDWDPYVSGRHAEVHLDLGGHTVVDAHSSNGTYVNFSRIPPAERVELAAGDVVKVGRTVVVYQAEGNGAGGSSTV
jgi:DNA-binding transcriptional ArsR family regulator